MGCGEDMVWRLGVCGGKEPKEMAGVEGLRTTWERLGCGDGGGSAMLLWEGPAWCEVGVADW